MKTLLSLDSGDLVISDNDNSQRINWSENVTFDDYKQLLLLAAKTAEEGYINVIIDRSDLGELPAECRVWMKNEYLKEYASKVIPTLRKVAIIQSKSILGQIYFSTISKAVPLKYPNLAFKSFNDEKNALEWISEGQKLNLNEATTITETPSAEEVKSKNSLFNMILKLFK